MDGTEGLVRGQICTDVGSPIRIPVGPETLGRIINVIGEPIDERGPVNAKRLASARTNFLSWSYVLIKDWGLVVFISMLRIPTSLILFKETQCGLFSHQCIIVTFIVGFSDPCSSA